MTNSPIADFVLKANREVHSRLASSYEETEPHFRPENQEKVKQRLETLRRRVPGGKLLDVGCGTGFIIHLAVDYFDEIHGIDITPAMMARIQTDLGNITLHESPAEQLPFPDNSFDAASAYSFMDHLLDPDRVLREVARVLKPGGIFYMDLNPNRLYWQALMGIPNENRKGLSDVVGRELWMVSENDKKIEQDFNIPAATFRAAEPGKEQGGLNPYEFCDKATAAGFSNCEVTFDWFLGQGPVMHGQSFAEAAIVEKYLRRTMPLTEHMFKYLYFHATK